ncbi:phosphoglycerate mutase 2 [Geranomyces michiganensis]|nr:phosphoglycerate mutase 2 [Geranomyces michiganensis]
MLLELHAVRHGATEWSVSGQHTGRTDIPLTAAGRAQAGSVKEYYHTTVLGAKPFASKFSHIFSSPLSRAHETARIVTSSDPTAVIELDDDLMEMDYGRYDGRKTKDIQADGEASKSWNLFRDGCPGGETAADVGRRADSFIAKVRKIAAENKAKGDERDVLFFSHGHFLRILAARWLGLPAENGQMFAISTAAVSILGFDHDETEPCIKMWSLPPSSG